MVTARPPMCVRALTYQGRSRGPAALTRPYPRYFWLLRQEPENELPGFKIDCGCRSWSLSIRTESPIEPSSWGGHRSCEPTHIPRSPSSTARRCYGDGSRCSSRSGQTSARGDFVLDREGFVVLAHPDRARKTELPSARSCEPSRTRPADVAKLAVDTRVHPSRRGQKVSIW